MEASPSSSRQGTTKVKMARRACRRKEALSPVCRRRRRLWSGSLRCHWCRSNGRAHSPGARAAGARAAVTRAAVTRAAVRCKAWPQQRRARRKVRRKAWCRARRRGSGWSSTSGGLPPRLRRPPRSAPRSTPMAHRCLLPLPRGRSYRTSSHRTTCCRASSCRAKTSGRHRRFRRASAAPAYGSWFISYSACPP